jgi:thiopeptide-type bacteriocin biosynthesis protein
MYEPLDSLQVRTPLFPVEAYLALGQAENATADALAVSNPRVQRALAVGSLALLDELKRASASSRDHARGQRKLLRYLVRMATRPTPYGLFVGVGIAHFGDATDLQLAEHAYTTQTRPDMGWLLNLVWMLERLPEVRMHLCLFANTAAYVRRGRIFLLEPLSVRPQKATEAVSIRATGVAMRALRLARLPVAYPELVEALLTSTPGATHAQVDGLISTLWQHTLLISDLQPPLTIASPASYLKERLAAVPPLASVARRLEEYLQAIDAWDHAPESAGGEPYRALIEQAQQITALVEQLAGPQLACAVGEVTGSSAGEKTVSKDPRSSVLLQVDTALQLAGKHITRTLSEEVARAAELMLRLSPVPGGFSHIQTFRQAFVARYGEEREVPLLEALDPQLGLGVELQAPQTGQQNQKSASWPLFPGYELEVRRLALCALRERDLVVRLDEEQLQRLETCKPAEQAIPPSLDIYVLVATASVEDLDRGDYLIVIGPNIGAMQAGRNLGRFADMLGSEAREALRCIAEREASQAPEHLLAELVYLPHDSRIVNVTLRPTVRSHEVIYGVMPGVDHERVIPMDELMLGVRDGRLYVHWSAERKDVIIRAGHMLNTMRAPAPVKLLSDLAQGQDAVISLFSWGECKAFPFLPRVQVGRVVLSLARWRISTQFHLPELQPQDSPDGFFRSLERWRRRWQVPRYVYLSQGDNRLLLDLTSSPQAEELRATLRVLRQSETLVLEEALPGPEHAWLPGPGGHYLAEFVISLLRRKSTRVATGYRQEPGAVSQPSLTVASALSPDAGSRQVPAGKQLARLRPPGSEWLFMKLYCAQTLQEDLIAGSIRAFIQTMLQRRLAADWFFIRYTDSEPHIRLRFCGDPQQLICQLLPELCRWGEQLMSEGPCQKFTFDVYEREIERYGCPVGIEAAEQLFCADSTTVVDMLSLLRAGRKGASVQEPASDLADAQILAVLSADDLLAGLGLSTDQRLQWYRAAVPTQKASGALYRRKGARLRALLGDPRELAGLAGGETLMALFATRRARLASVARQLEQAIVMGELTRPAPLIYQSFIHMHCNRFWGIDRIAERETLQLLLRTRTGLERSPVLARP